MSVPSTRLGSIGPRYRAPGEEQAAKYTVDVKLGHK